MRERPCRQLFSHAGERRCIQLSSLGEDKGVIRRFFMLSLQAVLGVGGYWLLTTSRAGRSFFPDAMRH
jgi:hypothetical protein